MELKIKLKVKNTEIELTKDEVIELKKALDDIAGWKTEKEYVPIWDKWYIPAWWERPWYPNDPYIIYTDSSWTTNKISDDVQVSYSYS